VTKTSAYSLLPPLALAVGIGLWRVRRALPPRAVAARAAAAAAPVLVILGGWILLARVLDRPSSAQLSGALATSNVTEWRELLSYIWQYYLPRLPGQKPFAFAFDGHPAFHTWGRQIWAAFGWLEVKLPQNAYRALGGLTAVVGAGAAVALWRARRRIDWAVAGFLALAVIALLAGLHWTDYHIAKAGGEFIQGRYLFPVVGVGGVALAAAVSALPSRARGAVAGAVIGGLFAFHLLSLGLVLERFYA
jgi:hypothetical protein